MSSDLIKAITASLSPIADSNLAYVYVCIATVGTRQVYKLLFRSHSYLWNSLAVLKSFNF